MKTNPTMIESQDLARFRLDVRWFVETKLPDDIRIATRNGVAINKEQTARWLLIFIQS